MVYHATPYELRKLGLVERVNKARTTKQSWKIATNAPHRMPTVPPEGWALRFSVSAFSQWDLYTWAGGRVVTTKAGKQFKRDVGRLALANLPIPERAYLPLSGRCQLLLDWHTTARARGDCDNLIKAIQDGLEDCGFWANDRQVYHLRVLREDLRPGLEPYVVVTAGSWGGTR